MYWPYLVWMTVIIGAMIGLLIVLLTYLAPAISQLLHLMEV